MTTVTGLARSIPFLVVPSTLWRVAEVLGVPLVGADVAALDGSCVARAVAVSALVQGAAMSSLLTTRSAGHGSAERWLAAANLGVAAAAAVFAGVTVAEAWSSVRRDVGVNDLVRLACALPLLGWGPGLAWLTAARQRRQGGWVR